MNAAYRESQSLGHGAFNCFIYHDVGKGINLMHTVIYPLNFLEREKLAYQSKLLGLQLL